MTISPDYFSNLTAQINAVNDCAVLQQLVDEAMQPLVDLNNTLTQQVAALAPILALLSAPVSPTAAVTWITNYISNVLTPQYAPYTAMVAQATQLISEVSALTTAINNAASRIGSCSITIPPL